MRPYVPLGILSIAAYVEERGFDVEVFDTTFSNRTAFLEHLRERPPAIIGIYTNLMTRRGVIETMKTLRGDELLRDTVVVLGGPEVTHHVEKLIESGADIIVIGEGEETTADITERIAAGASRHDLGDVQGIAFRNRDGEIIRTPPRPLIKDIDILPMPKREAVDLDLYLDAWKQAHGTSAVSISTMRGCPFTCRWCSRAVYGESYRRRSPVRVVDEMIVIRDRYHPDTLWFVDDVFTINTKWNEEFASELARRDVRIPYECITRADRLTPRLVDLLAETGCIRVWIGAESGSQRILDAMDRRVTVGQVQETIGMCRERGIETGTFIMLGYPGETEEDILATIDHLKRASPDLFTVTVAYPITGTPFHQEVRDDIVDPLPWELSSDRELRYARPYSDRYYRFALRRMVNEVELHKLHAARTAASIKGATHLLKAFAARVGMILNR